MPYFIIYIAVGQLEYAIKIGLLFHLYCLFTGVLITDRFYTDSLITDRLFTDRLFTAESIGQISLIHLPSGFQNLFFITI